MERAKTILTETLFSKSCNGQNDLVSLPGGRIADSLIYRLTFDPEESEDDDYYRHIDDEKQLFTNNNHLKSSLIDIKDNDGNIINVCPSNWDTHDDHNNNGDSHDVKSNEPEFPTLFMSQSTIKLNVSSLADEIIDSEMNSLKCLQNKAPPSTMRTTTASSVTISDENDHSQGLVDEINDKTIVGHHNYRKSTGQRPSNEMKSWKSLIFPSIMRGTINTETSIITYNCPPTRSYLSCCVIS